MKRLSVITLTLAALGLSACDQDVKIVDGQIPQEFVAQVQPMLGTYTGQMERQANALTFHLEGNRLIATSASDLIGSGCQSQIGSLLSIQYTESSDHQVRITHASFALDPNLCANQVLGTKLELSFRADGHTFDVSVMDHWGQQQICHFEGGSAYHPPMQVCRIEATPVYLEGTFKK